MMLCVYPYCTIVSLSWNAIHVSLSNFTRNEIERGGLGLSRARYLSLLLSAAMVPSSFYFCTRYLSREGNENFRARSSFKCMYL